MKIYISAPINRSQKDTDDVIREVKESDNNANIMYWSKSSNYYNENWIPESDAVIVLLPDNRFGVHCKNLPIGVRKEVERCININKKIFVAYRVKNGEMRIYESDIDTLPSGRFGISGKGGTTHRFNMFTKSLNRNEDTLYQPEMVEIYDKRILLAM